MAPLRLSNLQARRLWLQCQLLDQTPTGPLDLMGLIRQLGFVQLDTIQVVSRAHHHILWSRNQNYREEMFDPLLARDRAVFEHFTHDASVIPMEFLPYWQRQFARMQARMGRAGWWKGLPDAAARAEIRARIAREGALSTHAFESGPKGTDHAWARPPHKMALDYMWYAGELATCYRENFTKYYNLPERVFPEALRACALGDEAQLDWLCRAALARLGVATAGEIQKFWEACSAKECRAWVAGQDLVEVEVEGADGSWRPALALPDIEARIAALRPATTRLRILNPFDPALRDRDRLQRLFGMDYRIEIFVPAAKRKFGYYVYPMLEAERMVGRIEVVADRKRGVLEVKNLWVEPGVSWGAARQGKLESELARLARFVGCRYG